MMAFFFTVIVLGTPAALATYALHRFEEQERIDRERTRRLVYSLAGHLGHLRSYHYAEQEGRSRPSPPQREKIDDAIRLAHNYLAEERDRG